MEHKSELSNSLEKLSELKLTAIHVGLVEKTTEKDANYPSHKYLQDNWSVTISYKGKEYTTSYFSGIGHRKLISSVQKDNRGYYNKIFGDFKNEKGACEAQWLKLIPPTLANVMHCLLLDGRSATGTFEDFCGDLGYDSDSRKALETYLACQVTFNGMLKMLGTELFDKLSSLEH